MMERWPAQSLTPLLGKPMKGFPNVGISSGDTNMSGVQPMKSNDYKINNRIPEVVNKIFLFLGYMVGQRAGIFYMLANHNPRI